MPGSNTVNYRFGTADVWMGVVLSLVGMAVTIKSGRPDYTAFLIPLFALFVLAASALLWRAFVPFAVVTDSTIAFHDGLFSHKRVSLADVVDVRVMGRRIALVMADDTCVFLPLRPLPARHRLSLIADIQGRVEGCEPSASASMV
ncbi:MAG TPA: hypothetical protein VFG89_10865 [Coriobacteriia bacterium]|nr:hypothetical protein [Coriobacteriia bacterium]